MKPKYQNWKNIFHIVMLYSDNLTIIY